MKTLRLLVAMVVVVAVGSLTACSGTTAKSPEVADGIRKSLDEANLKHVSVSQDRDKGIVTLGGEVTDEDAKARALDIAKALAGEQVVANEIAVVPEGVEKDAKAVNSDLDQGIEKILNATLIQNQMHDSVKYEVKNAVVTLSGDVSSQDSRSLAEKLAIDVPYVKQIVNNLQVKNQKATSSQ